MFALRPFKFFAFLFCFLSFFNPSCLYGWISINRLMKESAKKAEDARKKREAEQAQLEESFQAFEKMLKRLEDHYGNWWVSFVGSFGRDESVALWNGLNDIFDDIERSRFSKYLMLNYSDYLNKNISSRAKDAKQTFKDVDISEIFHDGSKSFTGVEDYTTNDAYTFGIASNLKERARKGDMNMSSSLDHSPVIKAIVAFFNAVGEGSEKTLLEKVEAHFKTHGKDFKSSRMIQLAKKKRQESIDSSSVEVFRQKNIDSLKVLLDRVRGHFNHWDRSGEYKRADYQNYKNFIEFLNDSGRKTDFTSLLNSDEGKKLWNEWFSEGKESSIKMLDGLKKYKKSQQEISQYEMGAAIKEKGWEKVYEDIERKLTQLEEAEQQDADEKAEAQQAADNKVLFDDLIAVFGPKVNTLKSLGDWNESLYVDSLSLIEALLDDGENLSMVDYVALKKSKAHFFDPNREFSPGVILTSLKAAAKDQKEIANFAETVQESDFYKLIYQEQNQKTFEEFLQKMQDRMDSQKDARTWDEAKSQEAWKILSELTDEDKEWSKVDYVALSQDRPNFFDSSKEILFGEFSDEHDAAVKSEDAIEGFFDTVKESEVYRVVKEEVLAREADKQAVEEERNLIEKQEDGYKFLVDLAIESYQVGQNYSEKKEAFDYLTRLIEPSILSKNFGLLELSEDSEISDLPELSDVEDLRDLDLSDGSKSTVAASDFEKIEDFLKEVAEDGLMFLTQKINGWIVQKVDELAAKDGAKSKNVRQKAEGWRKAFKDAIFDKEKGVSFGHAGAFWQSLQEDDYEGRDEAWYKKSESDLKSDSPFAPWFVQPISRGGN